MRNGLWKKYKETIVPELMKEFGYKSYLSVPKCVKVVLNIGLGKATEDHGLIEKAAQNLSLVTGQKAVPTYARKAIAGFKLIKGAPIGVKVTLRKAKMYDFLEKLFRIVLPRIRDFKGLSRSSFDQDGNFTIGLAEQTIFPEVETSITDKIKGLEITIVTNAKTIAESGRLLELLGMPFVKGGT